MLQQRVTVSLPTDAALVLSLGCLSNLIVLYNESEMKDVHVIEKSYSFILPKKIGDLAPSGGDDMNCLKLQSATRKDFYSFDL